jgi:hypothetical protein
MLKRLVGSRELLLNSRLHTEAHILFLGQSYGLGSDTHIMLVGKVNYCFRRFMDKGTNDCSKIVTNLMGYDLPFRTTCSRHGCT